MDTNELHVSGSHGDLFVLEELPGYLSSYGYSAWKKIPSRSFLLLIPLFFTVDTLVLIKCVNSLSSQCSLGPGNGGESNREERSAFIK